MIAGLVGRGGAAHAGYLWAVAYPGGADLNQARLYLSSFVMSDEYIYIYTYIHMYIHTHNINSLFTNLSVKVARLLFHFSN